MKNNKLLHTIVTLLSLYVSTIAQTAPNYVPSNGLVGWWPFNGNSNDGSGNGNNGAVYGATLTNDRNGNANSAYLTSTGYLMCGNTNIPTNGVMTVAIWFKNYSDFNIGEVVCLGSTSNTTWGCVMGHNYFTTNYGRGCSSTGSSPSNISIDTNWHHVVFVSGGLNTTTNIYFDGMFFGTTTNANSNGSCDFTNLYFGNDIYSGDSHGLYNGILDDIGIWNRNLDSCEIKDLYFGSLGNCNTSGINRNISNNLFSISPNPAQNLVNIKADSKLVSSKYVVYNNIGEVVASGKIFSENTFIELGNLPAGIYLFSIGENLNQKFKVMKE